MKEIQFLSIIYVLYFIGQNTCGVLCVQSINIKQSAVLKDETSNRNSNQEVIRSQRESEKLDLTTDANNLTEGRAARSVLGSRRHLKENDANQVANYFLTGGPLKGHSHFVGSSNCNSNNDESDTVGLSNPKNTNDANLLNDEDDNTNSSDSLLGVPHIPALHPYSLPLHLYNGRVNSLFHPPLTSTIPHIPVRGSVLHSILHPRLHPHINKLRTIPRTFFRAASIPFHGLLNAHSQLQHALLPHLPLHQPLHQPLLGSSKSLGKSETNSVNDLTDLNEQYEPTLGASSISYNSKIPSTQLIHPDYFPHLQPTGYIVKFVPHNKQLLSPIVGSPQQPSSDCTDNNLNTEQNVSSVNNKDEDIGVTQQDEALGENADDE